MSVVIILARAGQDCNGHLLYLVGRNVLSNLTGKEEGVVILKMMTPSSFIFACSFSCLFQSFTTLMHLAVRQLDHHHWLDHVRLGHVHHVRHDLGDLHHSKFGLPALV